MNIPSMIFLWATPRSVSTALERVMKNSLELDVIHEPFTDVYYFSEERRSDRYGSANTVQKRDISSSHVNNSLLSKSINKRVFVKDLAFQAEPYVSPELLEKGQHVLITRHPQQIYQSLIKLKPDFSEDEFGFNALSKIYKKLTKLGKTINIIDGDAFSRDPDIIVRNLCNSINVKYDPSMLHWKSGQIRRWDNHESESQAKWHKTLESSNTIKPTQSHQTQVEIADLHRECFQDALAIYDEMLHHMQWVPESMPV